VSGDTVLGALLDAEMTFDRPVSAAEVAERYLPLGRGPLSALEMDALLRDASRWDGCFRVGRGWSSFDSEEGL
jgi:hypothetical protein